MSDFYEKLSADMPALIETWIVTKSQAERLLTHYRLKPEEPTSSKLVPILSVIGATFVGVGFILYFASNWDLFSDWQKLAILVTATVSVHAAALILLYVREYKKTGHAMALLWSLLYGASIFLVGQTFNLWGTFPEALLLWLAGVLPMAYATGLASFPVLLSLLFAAWLFSDFSQTYSRSNEAAMVWIPSVIWIFLTGISVWHGGKYESFKKAFSRLGFFALLSWFFLFTFEGLLDTFQGWSRSTGLLAAFVATGAAAYAIKLLKNRDASLPSLLPAFHFAALAAVFALVPWLDVGSWSAYSSYDRPIDATRFAVLAFTNAYFVALAIAGIASGIAKKDSFTVNLSLAAVTVFVFAKYFDWFFDMMDRALFFIFWGVLFVTVGFLIERRRKKILASISE